MPIVFEGAANGVVDPGAFGSSVGLTIAVPGTPSDGDLLVFCGMNRWDAYTPDYPANGYFTVLAGTSGNAAGPAWLTYTNYHYGAFSTFQYRFWSAGDPTSYTWSPYHTDLRMGSLLRFSGVASFGGITSLRTTTSGNSLRFYNPITDADNCLLLALCAGRRSGSYSGNLADFTTRTRIQSTTGDADSYTIYSASAIRATAGSSGNGSNLYNDTNVNTGYAFQTNRYARSIVAWFRPASDGLEIPSAVHLHTANQAAALPDLQIAGAAHLHAAGAAQAQPDLQIAGVAHFHVASPTSASPDLLIASSVHLHAAAAAAALTDLLIPDALQLHVAGSATARPDLALASAVHQHAADAAVASPDVSIEDAAHLHVADPLAGSGQLEIANVVHPHIADPAAARPDLSIVDSSHFHVTASTTVLPDLTVPHAIQLQDAAPAAARPDLAIPAAIHQHASESALARPDVSVSTATLLHVADPAAVWPDLSMAEATHLHIAAALAASQAEPFLVDAMHYSSTGFEIAHSAGSVAAIRSAFKLGASR